MNTNYDVITIFPKKFILRRTGVAIFADIIKIWPRLLKQSLKTQENLEKIEIMYLNGIYVFLDIAKFADF